ncbi:MAG: 4Fe-4S dicluster domain-containing protein [Desulfobacteraceae bacterium]|nr:4Fe-4S dicluster domain-containing protein [Desulfobacteraceae bacterium]
MKTAIIFFSQTNNTLKVAEQICDGIFEDTGQCDLLKMEEVSAGSLTDYDLIGVGCPVFYFKEPFNVRHFIEGLPQQKNKHWFVFCSHGAVMGQTLLSMTKCLEKKDALVIGSHHTYANITVPFYPKHTLTSGHPDDLDLREAFQFGKAMVKCSNAVYSGDTSYITKPSPVHENWAKDGGNLLTHALLSQTIPRLSINLETCIQCNECQNSCPVNGIDIESDPPRIQEPCIFCLHCASICPSCSIEADWSPLVKMAPANYARYKEALNDAKDRGEFRWLIDPETVDCSYPLHKQREHEIKDD